LGKIYFSHDEESFSRLPFSESALRAIREAGKLYNSGRRDHALIEMFKEIEKVLKELSETTHVSVEADAAGYIRSKRRV
jgi:hypothetical protein